MDNDLKTIFGTRIGNALGRNGIYSIQELKEYIEKYPFYESRKWYLWMRIGEQSYKIIETYLKENEP